VIVANASRTFCGSFDPAFSTAAAMMLMPSYDSAAS